jgi:mono/diheme cytochrome c family protein
MAFSASRALVPAVSLVAAFALALACSSESGGGSSGGTGDAGSSSSSGGNLDLDAFPNIDAAEIELSILPEESFTGFDGQHTFKVPVAVYRTGADLQMVLSDPNLADIKPASVANPEDNGRYYLLTPKKVGSATLTATSRGKSVTAKFTVQSYTPARYAAGEARYKNGGNGDPSCASCHQKAGGADHSPTALSSATDADIVATITSGIKVGGIPITSVTHTWTVSQAEQDGLVTYLRGLPPLGYTER